MELELTAHTMVVRTYRIGALEDTNHHRPLATIVSMNGCCQTLDPIRNL
jgi:hypothetical protein